MDHEKRGKFILINNVNFKKESGMADRSGSDKDAKCLYERFTALDFDVKDYRNLTVEEMKKVLKQAAKDSPYNRDADCFACALLSHGDEGIIYGTDKFVKIEELVTPFYGENCRELAGKPKIFIIQACRGVKCDPGVLVTDSDVVLPPKSTMAYKIPSLADFLFAYSTVPGYFSWRNSSEGSWFIQAIGKVFKVKC